MKDLRDKFNKKQTNTQVDVVEQILDESNFDNIILYDPQKKPIEFEQIAVIPLEDERAKLQTLYTIMIPLTPMQGVNEGEGVVFKINERTRDIDVVNDENIIDRVLEVYQKLIEDGEGEKE